MNVDRSMWNKKIRVKKKAFSGTYCNFGWAFYDQDNKQISKGGTGCAYDYDGTFVVPENTTKIQFELQGNVGLHEVNAISQETDKIIKNGPVIDNTNYYPTITNLGVIPGSNEVTIQYSLVNNQKLYRVNGGEWQEYQNQPIKIETNDIVEAKEIDKNGIERAIVSYTLKDDKLGKEAYDNNIETYFRSAIGNEGAGYYINVDSSIWNKQIWFSKNVFSGLYCGLSINVLNSEGNTMITHETGCGDYNGLITIPTGASKLKFWFQGNVGLLEIAPVGLHQTVGNPIIQINKVDSNSNKLINIEYPTGYTNEYSLDLGKTWIQYRDTLTIEKTSTIFARSIDRNGKVVSSSSFNVTIVRQPKNIVMKIKEDNPIIAQAPTLTTSTNNTNDPSGLYSSTETNSGNKTYYFRGNVENNYVSFAGETWRIVRINEDETVKIMRQDPLSGYYAPGNIYYSENNFKSIIDNWYNNNLINYTDKIELGDYFCEQAKVGPENITIGNQNVESYNTYIPNFRCEIDANGKSFINTKVALLSYDEVVFAGGYFGKNNPEYYLYNTNFSDNPTYTISPSNESAIWLYANSNGLSSNPTHGTNYLRPVINLKADTMVIGTGNSTDPYVVQ